MTKQKTVAVVVEEDSMARIEEDIAAYETMRSDMEARHTNEWVLIHDQQLIGTYPTFDDAAQEAVARFGRGPYFIREIGAPPVRLPSSVMYHAIN